MKVREFLENARFTLVDKFTFNDINNNKKDDKGNIIPEVVYERKGGFLDSFALNNKIIDKIGDKEFLSILVLGGELGTDVYFTVK